MSADPAYELQKAIWAIATTSPGNADLLALAESFGAEDVFLYDKLPRGDDGLPTVPYPFGELQDIQVVRREPQAGCDDEMEAFATVVWWDEAEDRGKTGAQRLASEFGKLAGQVLSVTGFSVSVGHVQDVRHQPIRDGVARSVLTLRYLLDPV